MKTLGVLFLCALGIGLTGVIADHFNPALQPLTDEARQQNAEQALASAPLPRSSELRDNMLAYQQTAADALIKEAVELVQQGRPSAAKALYEQRRNTLKASIDRLDTSRMNVTDRQQVLGSLQSELFGVETVIMAKHFIYQ